MPHRYPGLKANSNQSGEVRDIDHWIVDNYGFQARGLDVPNEQTHGQEGTPLAANSRHKKPGEW